MYPGSEIDFPLLPKVSVPTLVPPMVSPVFAVNTSISEVNPPTKLTIPVFPTVNFVVPLALAAMMSPLFAWFTMRAPLFPIPPLIDSGAGVVALPTNTAELKSLERVVLPEPAEVKLKLPFVPVVIVDEPLFPTVIVPPDAPIFRDVAALPKFNVVAVLSNKVSEAWFVVIVAAPLNANAPDVVSVASELAVIVAVFPNVSPAAVFNVPNEVALIVEVPLNVVVPAFTVNSPATPPLFGLIAMFPVLAPPIVKVLLFRDWIVPGLSDSPFTVPLAGFAEILATGVEAPATPVKANLAPVVAVPPKSRSSVMFAGESAPRFSCQKFVVPVAQLPKLGVAPPKRH